MATHKFVLDNVFEKEQHTLIAIHCTIEDSRLAYLINKYLGIRLKRKLFDLDYNNGASSYSIFEWKDKKKFRTWNLVSNVCKVEMIQQNNEDSLFSKQEKIIRVTNLIPEYKQVNFFLKIDNTLEKEKEVISMMLDIPQVSTAYTVDINRLKSKDNLIFS